jgi:hypothetical protein
MLILVCVCNVDICIAQSIEMASVGQPFFNVSVCVVYVNAQDKPGKESCHPIALLTFNVHASLENLLAQLIVCMHSLNISLRQSC